jgi:hypothetical protein
MRDWREYVRQRLGSMRLEHDETEPVMEELASHLEECYLKLRAAGLDEEEADARALALAGDWEELRQGIISAKEAETMSDRVRQIWIPSFITLVVGWVAPSGDLGRESAFDVGVVACGQERSDSPSALNFYTGHG